MRFRFERCMEKGKIIKVWDNSDFANKELKEARDDLKSAEKSINGDNPKWAIVQSYYTMFHAFRALLFTKGYREKSHACLKHAIEALFVDEGVIDSDLLDDFDFAMKAEKRQITVILITMNWLKIFLTLQLNYYLLWKH